MHNSGDILRVNGFINTVNDAVIGGIAGISGASKFAGQLGQVYEADNDNLIFSASVGTVWGGQFQYVRLAAAAGAVALGQILFWDLSVAQTLYQVTSAETGTTPGAQMIAGINLNPSWTAGNYGFIQILGPVDVKFRAALTGAPNIGVSVYAAAAGAGADNGRADVLATADPANYTDVGLFLNRLLGTAIELPVAGGTTLVDLKIQNPRF